MMKESYVGVDFYHTFISRSSTSSMKIECEMEQMNMI